jgi:alanine-glyoxylate transaminase/serine-glyoxylate transaminase/serine-pyruvate transaminase
MEASIANTVEPGDSVLICINGYFGERLAEMAKRYGGNVYIIRKKWGEVFSPEEVKLALEEKPVKIVGLVHAETSTGALQPLEEITKIVHNHGALLIVDAVTSLGGIPILVDDIGIDVCYSGTQKCLSCPPGLGPITFGPKAIDKLQNRKLPVTSWYLDLSLVHKYWGGERTYHHTAPISSIYALYEGLRIIAEEGLENRWIRHQKTAELFWEGLEQIGLECHVDYKNRLPSLTTIKVPEGVDELSVRQRLLNDYFIEIAGGLGELKGKVWRVGFMGYSSNEENVYLLLEALKTILK